MPDIPSALQPTLDLPSSAQEAPTLTRAPSATGGSAPAAGGKLPRLPGYEIVRILGHGGMGVVYLARQTALDRLVALKMIHAGGAAGPDQLARFQAEAQAVAKLQHPNIVQIHEVGEHDGAPFFSLEYVAGGSLDEALAGAPLPPNDAAELVETLARAMHYAHGQGVVHRDLKPANVLLSAEFGVRNAELKIGSISSELRAPRSGLRTPKITDFGLAKRLEGDSGQMKSGAILGTPSYMAPEQAGGKKEVGPAADVYALGAILYELLTGRPPFRAATALDTLMQVVDQEPVPPRRLLPNTPADLDAICLRCLEKEPKRRYASAAALADDLRLFLENKPTTARPAGAVERARKWIRRNPRMALRFAVVLVCMIALLAYREDSRRRLHEEKANAERQREQALQSQQAAEREKKRAEQRLTKAIAALDQMVFRVADGKMAQLPQMQEERKKLLERAADFYQGFLKEESDDPRLRREMARAYYLLARLHVGLGEEAKAKTLTEQAAALQRALLAADPNSQQLGLDLARSEITLGALAGASLDFNAALGPNRSALARLEALCAADPDAFELQEAYAEAIRFCGFFSWVDRKQAEGYFKQALAHAQAAILRKPDDGRLRVLLGAARTSYGYFLVGHGETAEAEPLLEQGFAEMTYAGEEALTARNRYMLAFNCAARGFARLSKRQLKEAQPLLEKAIRHYDEALAIEPRAFHLHMQAARAYDALVQLMANEPDTDAAAQTFRRALAHYDFLHENYPQTRFIPSQRDTARIFLQIMVARQGDHVAAIAGPAPVLPIAEKNQTHAYNVACVYAQALAAAGRDAKLPAAERKKLEEECAAAAFRWLETAKKLGFFGGKASVDSFKSDKDLDPLRRQPAYSTFVEGLPK